MTWHRQEPASPAMVAAPDDWLSAPEVARLLRLQLHTVHALIDRGELEAEITSTNRSRADLGERAGRFPRRKGSDPGTLQ